MAKDRVPTPDDSLADQASSLGLHGVLAHWDEFKQMPWLPRLIELETAERTKRSLNRRLQFAKLSKFKSIADFDWDWPKKIDREAIEELFDMQYIHEAENVILIGPNGCGKTMLAKNLVYSAVIKGHTALFVTASHLLNDLAACESSAALARRLSAYATPRLLAIDELGYLSYHNRYADLLFEVVSRRYQNGSILVTTNKAFADWSEVFPNATSVVTLVDRLVHKAEIIQIDAESYRLKEAKERSQNKASRRAQRRRASS